jgi:hypothetical protein
MPDPDMPIAAITATLYDILAVPAPDGMEYGETRVTRVEIETADETPPIFPGMGIGA